MNTRTILIAIACGLGSALMFFAPLQLGSVGISLAYLALVPLFVSVLGFGTKAGIVSAVAAGLIFAIAFGPAAGLLMLAVNFAPAIWIGHSAGLAQSDEEATYWFPLEQILLRLAVMATMVTFVMAYALGLTPDSIGDLIREMTSQALSNMAVQGSGSQAPTEVQLENMAERVIALMPLVLPASMLIMYVLNLHVGTSIARGQKWMLRPKDDIPATAAMPMIGIIIFAAALGFSLLGGPLGIVGKVVAGAFGAALMLVGFATMHFLTRGVAGRGMWLTIAYVATFILFFPTFLFVMLGLAETLLGLRARRGLPSQS